MKSPIVLIGIGELAGEFARGFLRCGHPVYPINRQMDMAVECLQIPDPELILITVPENELRSVLNKLPEVWKNKVVLVQNELLPYVWQRHNIDEPTVAVVWFEKKPNMALTNILYTPVYGPHAKLMADVLEAMKIPSKILESDSELVYELARKTLYILTVNICGLYYQSTVKDLWEQRKEWVLSVSKEVLSIIEWLTQRNLPRDRLVDGMVEGIYDCPDRNSLGRSAGARLDRALNFAKEARIPVPELIKIKRHTETND